MAVIIWWCLLISSYIVYPVLMRILAKARNITQYSYYDKTDDLPGITILMAVHNEEKVLEHKLQSVFSCDYDLSKIKMLIGLDNCSDNSAEIVKTFQAKFPEQIFVVESERLGKPQMLNYLFEKFQPTSELTVFTDANVIFTGETLYELAKFFKTQQMGLVDTKFLLSEDIVSHQLESEYLGFEQELKYHEGIVWGTMQGPFGGCFAIRTKLFEPIPDRFIVDDFFIGMNVMKQGFYAILNPSAIVIEEVHTSWKEEYRRKQRIAAGNFQNLKYFSSVLTKPFTALSVSWFFHKILRWTLPVMLVPAILIGFGEFYCFGSGFWASLITLILIIGVVASLYILQRLTLQSRTIERLSYFIYINLALVQGFIIYIKGIQSNVWKPTQRK